jgi:hypothetical protein
VDVSGSGSGPEEGSCKCSDERSVHIWREMF